MAYESKKLKINLLAEMQTQSARSNQVEACSCTCISQIGCNCTACLPRLHAFIFLFLGSCPDTDIDPKVENNRYM